MNLESTVEIAAFQSALDWERWLGNNHANSIGVWLQFFKKGSTAASVNYAEALSIALCYGWIDGQLKKHDDESWLRKFTPRRARSMWSKRNCDLANQLVKDGKMKSAGLREIATAKQDGRWDQAYDSPRKMKLPEDFLKLLSKNKKALVHFKALNKANTYAITWRLQTAKKPATRDKRLKAIIEMLSEGRRFHE